MKYIQSDIRELSFLLMTKPKLGIAWPQPQFPHSCVREHIYIFPQDRPTYFPAAEYIGRLIVGWEDINRSQTHECGNWDCGHAIPFRERLVSNFAVLCLCSLYRASENICWHFYRYIRCILYKYTVHISEDLFCVLSS